MEGLVEDAGYAALLGTFGPALLDPTGSRPGARQSEGLAGPSMIHHPRELRAIPNNAILQQLGWCANTLQGLGAALVRHPQEFADLMKSSPRFRRAIEFAEHALRHSDLDVLHAVVATLDPKSWLDRAAHAAGRDQRDSMIAVSAALEEFGIWPGATSMLRRVQVDHLALRSVWEEAPHMAIRELLLHALRLTLVQRIWLLATKVPEFSPRHGVTRAVLVARLIRLDIPATLDLLSKVFPAEPDPAADRDYREPPGRRGQTAYSRQHAELFRPMAQLFGIIREISVAITHEVGAFG
ncbi:MAG: hypothetical protein EOO78_29985 [Oxalobacteraceae bacterium]|nr:MAG: hypothetical protein EOO78_29985 [Oxalobacteraceae bacterium]